MKNKMKHQEWIDFLKNKYDRYGMGYNEAHWETIKEKICYLDIIEKMDIYIFYVLAVRD